MATSTRKRVFSSPSILQFFYEILLKRLCKQFYIYLSPYYQNNHNHEVVLEYNGNNPTIPMYELLPTHIFTLSHSLPRMSCCQYHSKKLVVWQCISSNLYIIQIYYVTHFSIKCIGTIIVLLIRLHIPTISHLNSNSCCVQPCLESAAFHCVLS